MKVKIVHNKHLFDLLSSFQQKSTFLKMFSFTVVTKRSILFVGTLIDHVPGFITPKTNDFLRTFLGMMLWWKTIITWKFIQTGVIVMPCFFTPETFNILCEITEINRKNTDKWLFMYLQEFLNYLFFIEVTTRKLWWKIDLLIFLLSSITVKFSPLLRVFEASCYFVFFWDF